jgi:hypothetical protein
MATISTPKTKKVHWKFASMSEADDGVAKELFVVPKGSTVVSLYVSSPDYADTTSSLLDLGTSGTPEKYLANLDLDAGILSGFQPSATIASETTADEEIQGLLTLGTGDGAGAITVGIGYIRDLNK